MSGSAASYLESDDSVRDSVKERKCLRCREPFQSHWSGERVCTRCKGTTAWKSGEPLKPRSFSPQA